MEDSISIEALLAHEDWVRRLARRLLRDEALAEDVVQETWIATLAKPLHEVQNLRSWLHAVVQNLARKTSRDEARRRQVAEVASGELSDPRLDPAEILEREGLRRRVVELVLELEPKYRNVLVAHYLRELPQAEAAQLVGVPIATFRVRLMRARELLSQRIRQEQWDRRPMWLALAAGWGPEFREALVARLGGRVAVSSTGSAAVAFAWVAALALVAAAIGFVASKFHPGAGAEPPLTVVALDPVDSPDRPAEDGGPRGSAEPRAPAPSASQGGRTFTVKLWLGLPPYQPVPASDFDVSFELYEGLRAVGDPTRTLSGTTDERGVVRWDLDELDGAITCVIKCPAGFIPSSDDFVVLAPYDEPVVEWELLELDGELELDVRDTYGRPIAGGIATDGYSEVRTNAAGQVTLPTASNNQTRVRVHADGYGSQSFRLALPPKGDSSSLEVRMRSAISWSGLVLDVEGRPVDDATVTWSLCDAVAAKTDANGSYEFPFVDPISRLSSLRISKDGYADGFVSPRRDRPIRTVYLLRGTRFTGRVLGSDRQPLFGAQLRFVGKSSRFVTDYTGEDGYFDVRVDAGRFDTLLISADGHATTSLPLAVPDLRDAFSLGEVVLSEGRSLVRRLVDPNGHPLAGFRVQAMHRGNLVARTTFSDEGGMFRFSHLPSSEDLRVFVVRRGFSEHLDVDFAAQTDCVLEQRRGSFGLTVRDAVTGLPVRAFDFRVTGEGVPPFMFRSLSHTWSSDEIGLSPARGAETKVLILAEGYAREHVSVKVPASGEHVSVPVDLVRSASAARGTILSPLGAPIEGALIIPQLDDELGRDASSSLWTVTGPGGQFELHGLLGTRLAVEAPGYSSVESWTPSEAGPNELRLERARRLRGRLFDAQGFPAANRPFFVRPTTRPIATRLLHGTTDGRGEFEVPGVGTGRYQIGLMDVRFPSMNIGTVEWVLDVPDEETYFEFKLPLDGTGGLTGVLRELVDVPYKMRRVYVNIPTPTAAPEPAVSRLSVVVVEQDGRFLLHGVPAGVVTVNGALKVHGERRLPNLKQEVIVEPGVFSKVHFDFE